MGDALAGKVTGIGINTIMGITQAAYDELVMLGTVDESTLYIIKPESEDEGDDQTMIPVLRSDGAAWINLGITPIDGAWYEVCFRGIADIPLNCYIFGNKGTQICSGGGKLTATWVTGYYHGSSYATFGQVDLSKKHIFQIKPTALVLDGNEMAQITPGIHPLDKVLCLFAGNNHSYNSGNNQTGSDNLGALPSAIDLFYLRIWSGENKLLHNYVPAQDSEGVACIYDTVDKAYLYNAAESGAFEYREELEES